MATVSGSLSPFAVFRNRRFRYMWTAELVSTIGDSLVDIAAAILKPFVSEENLWMVEKHGVFQGYYFFHHLGMDRHLRDQFRDHPLYQRTAEFCALYDAPAFDPDYPNEPLSFFEPMLRRVFARPRQSMYRADR